MTNTLPMKLFLLEETMQIYTSPEFFGNYYVNFPITQSHLSNGMRTRMSALHYALQTPVITKISEATGDLLVEPFAIKPRVEDRDRLSEKGWNPKDWHEISESYVDEICEYQKGRKFLICSEMEVMRWQGNLREKMLSTMEEVFTTCKYQENLLKVVGVNSKRLAEPINESLFYPTPKKTKQIVATGAANHVKNTEMLIEFYRALEGKGYHRVYIGGLTLWSNVKEQARESMFQYNLDLAHELKSVCDEYHDASPGTKVARIFSESEFYANFAYHEVGCRTALEALMCGCGIIWGQHPLGEELPVCCQAETVAEAVSALIENTGKIAVQELRDYALTHYSFTSVRKQLEGHLYGY